MSLVLMSREDLEKRSLAHYRTPGSKNGVRLYQYKDGSLTPLGRIHYGVGLGRDRSGASVLVGKKQVNSEGTLTKSGIKKLEETIAKGGSYLNPSKEERKKGMTTERDKVASQRNKEYWEAVDKGMDTSSQNDKDRELWDKFKDVYAEATLKDLKLPVNEKNKGVVKDIFKKYDHSYEYGDYSGIEGEKRLEAHNAEIEANRKERFEKHEKTEKELNKSIGDKIKDFNEKTQEAKKERTEKDEARDKKLKEELSEIRSLTDMELNERITRLQKEKQYSELLNERANREKGPLQAMASKLFKEAAENLARKALNQAGDEVLKKLLKKGKNGNNDQNDKPKDNDKEPDKSNKPDSSKGQDNSSPSNSGGKFTKGEKAQIRSMAAAGKSIADIASSLGVTEDKVKGFMKSAGITVS